MGHWSRDCPQRRRPPSMPSTRPSSPSPSPRSNGPPPSANMFFVSEPNRGANDAGEATWTQLLNGASSAFTGFAEQTCFAEDCEPDMEPSSAVGVYMPQCYETFLSYTYASSTEEAGGSALVDTAAQHGLIGEQTLRKHDLYLQQHYRLRVQITGEEGGVLRVQVVPGCVPCLLPAYLLTQTGAVIDMTNLLLIHTSVNTFQYMKRRLSGHVEVSICEFGKDWSVPAAYPFLKSEVWDQGPFLTSPANLEIAVLNGSRQAVPVPEAMASLRSAIAIFMLLSSLRPFRADHSTTPTPRTSAIGFAEGCFGTTGQATTTAGAAAFGSRWGTGEPSSGQTPRRGGAGEVHRPRVEHVGRSKYLTPMLEATTTCRHRNVKHGANSDWSWTKCQDCGAIEQIPKVDIGQMQQWNNVLRYQAPDYTTPMQRKAEKAEKKATGSKLRSSTDVVTSSMVPKLNLAQAELRRVPPQTVEIGTPDSAELSMSERGQLNRELWKMEVDSIEKEFGKAEMEPPAMMQACPMCQRGCLHLMYYQLEARYVWRCASGDPNCQIGWPGHPEMEIALGIRLCLRCQQGALDTVVHMNRTAYRCPSCGDLTLASEWTQVLREHYRNGGFNPQEKTLVADLVDLGDIVNLSQAMVYWYNGSQDRWNLLNIDRQPTEPYELQAWMTTLVVQELKEDFVVYVRDIDLDPVEVTLDKSIKKELAAAIDRKIGAMDGFYDICEEGLDVCLDHHEIPGDVDGVESAWPHVDRQGTYLPVDLDLNWLIKDSEEVNWMEVWRTSDAGDTAACCDLSALHRDYRDCCNLVVLYRWPELKLPDSTTGEDGTSVYVTTSELTQREKAEAAKSCRTRENVIQYVLREFVCAGCAKERRPPTRLPSATPRCFDFNVVIGVDLLLVSGVRDAADLPVINITCLGTLYSTFGLVDVKRRTSSNTWAAFLRLWLRVFGAPQCVMYDEGKEFTGGAFQDGLEMHGIQPVEINRQAPFELGTVERRGGMFKEAFYRTRELLQPQTVEEVEEIIFETSWAIQTLTNRSGYSPAQRVFGKQPSLTLDKLTDGREYHLSPSADAAWEQSNRVRQAARRALMELDSKSRLSRARLARPRRELQQREFQEGEPVLVWRAGRRGATSKVGPCYVILQRGNTVWVSRRGDLWKCNVGQVFPMRVSDKDGLEAIPDELLKAKMRLKYDSEKLQYVDVESEMTGESQRPSGGRADAEQPPEPPEVLNPDPSEDLEEMLKDYSPSLPLNSIQNPQKFRTQIP
eukprot:s1629_g14.t2